jgi:hypothetical protein
MRIAKIFVVMTLILIASGCSTSAIFKIPDGSELYLYNRPQAMNVEPNGRVVTRPFFWTAAGGVPYRLEKDGSVIKEGKLKARFRPVSIFWPPGGLIYWPMGLNAEYDLN